MTTELTQLHNNIDKRNLIQKYINIKHDDTDTVEIFWLFTYDAKVKNKPKSQSIKTPVLPVHHHDALISDNYGSKLPYNILSVCCSVQHEE